ncbi:PIN domain-containing protein [Irpex rosettiformis]|uniref:PIN domain-containing protein n=1 Tax=Irpex rosettiformis TaxID=378272 RepID=A0ACB8UEG1_9APHY|nr:PIN domain-containing protein [Irpex rosettiformis]
MSRSASSSNGQEFYPANIDSSKHGDDTLSRITTIANDVEMHESQPIRGSVMGYLVLDTNVLIDDLNVLRDFSEDLDKVPALPISMKIIVPNSVLSELDGLKKREGLSWFARTASTLILRKIQERKTWKVQAYTETVGRKPLNHEQDRVQDISIFDCCCFFRTKGSVALMTNDVNLRTLCENEEERIHTIAPGKRQMSSRELAYELFGDNVDLNLFRGLENKPKYGPARSSKSHRLARTEAPRADDDSDGMDVDEDVPSPLDNYIPSHALDALHLQIIDHFTIVLKELAKLVREKSGEAGPPSQSQYAPAHRRKDFSAWTVRDCLEYLGTKKVLRPSQPPLRTFLLRRNEDREWRRGQDWPRQAWINAIEALEDIGNIFEDDLVLLSVRELWPHIYDVFSTPLRPTGI